MINRSSSGFAAALAALLAISCSAGILPDVQQAVVTVKQSSAPSVSTFSLTSASQTNVATVTFSLECPNASAYFIGESPTAPAASDSGWVATKPTTYVLATDGSHSLYAWAKDAAGSVSAAVAPITVVLDRIAPSISTFASTDPAYASTPIIHFTLSGTDAIGITGWLVKEGPASPAPTASLTEVGWTSGLSASLTPTQAAISSGSGEKYFYAFARDAAGNIGVASAPISIVYQDSANAPVLNSFTSPATYTTSTTITIAITYNSYATSWVVRQVAHSAPPTAPAAIDSDWTTYVPSSFTLPNADGVYDLYAWAKNAVGQVSSSKAITVTLDRTAPSISTFASTDPATTTAETIHFNLVGSDAVGITSWLVKEGPASPAPTASLTEAGWTTGAGAATAPSSAAISSGSGTKYFYAFARDAAGNIGAASAPISIIFQDAANAPSLDSLTGPTYTTSTSVLITITYNSFATAWVIRQVAHGATPTSPAAGDLDWTTTAPSSFTLTNTDGVYDVYAWAKNAAGQISSSKVITVTLDRVAPVIDTFTLTSGTPTASRDITFTMTPSATTTDIVDWIVNETSSAPASSSSLWTGTKPTGYHVASTGDGSKTVYIWAKDVAGNVSAQKSLSVYVHETPVAAKTVDGPTSTTETTVRLLAAHEPIYIKFSEAMDTASASLSAFGDLSGGTPSWDVATSTVLTLTPPASPTFWPRGTSKTLVVTAKSAAGAMVSQQLSLSYEVFFGVCVSQGGIGTNGYVLNPMGTIQSAIAFFSNPSSCYYGNYTGKGAKILVSTGTYNTNYAGGDKIEMLEGVSLIGGYAPLFASRNPATYTCTIADTSAAGGTSTIANPVRTIYCGMGITTATSIDGLIIKGGLGNFSAALLVVNASPSISNDTVVAGGDESGQTRLGIFMSGSCSPLITGNIINPTGQGGGPSIQYSRAIALTDDVSTASVASSPTITGNTIFGGIANTGSSSTSRAYAFYINQDTANPTIAANFVTGGTARNSYAFYVANASLPSSPRTDIHNNLIISGNVGAAGGTSANKYVFYLSLAKPAIRNNTITCGGGWADDPDNEYGVYMNGAKPLVENNILWYKPNTTGALPKRYGLYEVAGTSAIVSALNNNVFFNFDYESTAAHAVYHDESPSSLDYNDITALEAHLTTAVASLNANIDPALSTDYYPVSGSPATVRTGGKDGSSTWGFSDDKDGKARTGNGSTDWSIGCYEY